MMTNRVYFFDPFLDQKSTTVLFYSKNGSKKYKLYYFTPKMDQKSTHCIILIQKWIKKVQKSTNNINI